jgi:hypothetical protein
MHAKPIEIFRLPRPRRCRHQSIGDVGAYLIGEFIYQGSSIRIEIILGVQDQGSAVSKALRIMMPKTLAKAIRDVDCPFS